jgi:hypothetical protein
LLGLIRLAIPTAYSADSLLVVLADTGMSRDGYPVLKHHADEAAIRDVLSRGFSGKLLRLYHLEQTYLERAAHIKPEPAYLLFSNRQGGFPRFGFYLANDDKRHAGYVDLYRTKTLTGKFGSDDQIFPHELGHVIVRQLAGVPPQGGSNQLHALGVQTDPYNAWSEGFAEHFQVMSVDDPDAHPTTRALASDPGEQALARRLLANYSREVASRWAPLSPRRMGFLFWYSGTEQVLRYHAVKANLFARFPKLPEALLGMPDPYPAYLLQNILPGDPGDPVKPVPVLLSTEGVISALFHRWVTDPALQHHYRDEEFYGRFGTAPGSVTPLENAYLKLFHVLYTGKPQEAAAVIESYRSIFQDEAPLVDNVTRDALCGQKVSLPAAIWLANPDFQTGSSLFDQFRGLPRVHSFDLNASTFLDLISVPGVDKALANRILLSGPFGALSDLERVPGFSPDLKARFERMAEGMKRIRAAASEEESAFQLDKILRPYLLRALAALIVSTAAGSVLYKWARRIAVPRLILNSLAASLLAFAAGWIVIGAEGWKAGLFPVILFGIPASLWQAMAQKSAGAAVRQLLAWALASLPAVLLMQTL